MTVHQPVLLKEVLKEINPERGTRVIDATFGGGGHSVALAAQGADVLALDADPEAVREGERRLNILAGPPPFAFPDGSRSSGQIVLVHGRFGDLVEIAEKSHFLPVDAVLFDLGLSSDQLEAKRGFSFKETDGPLDMRYDPDSQGVTAADLLNTLSEKELYEMFTNYSQTSRARTFARLIVRARKIKPFKTVGDLLQTIEAVSTRPGKLHPATKIFLALRIVVNFELDELEKGLSAGWHSLKLKGKLLAISFHSGEDRIVKNFAIKMTGHTGLRVFPSSGEINSNPRARSAVLRVITKKV